MTSVTAHDYAWIRSSPLFRYALETGYTLTLVRGVAPREVLRVMEGAKEDKDSWAAFLRHLKGRGLAGVRLFVSDKCLGLVESLAEFYPQACWQRCAVHFYRNVRARRITSLTG